MNVSFRAFLRGAPSPWAVGPRLPPDGDLDLVTGDEGEVKDAEEKEPGLELDCLVEAVVLDAPPSWSACSSSPLGCFHLSMLFFWPIRPQK